MITDKLKRSKSDTDASSLTNCPDRLRQLRSLHHFIPSETLQGTIADNRPDVIDASRQWELSSLLEKAKPELPSEARLALETIEKYLKEDSEKKPSKDEYKNAIEKALATLSPDTLADYKNYGIEFVLNEGMSYPTARRIKEGTTKGDKWELNLPTKYEYPIAGMIYRCMDDLLKVEFASARDKVQASESQAEIATNEMLKKRIEITARVFQTNMMLAEKYAWDIKGYELAEKYYKDYNDGIRRAFEIGLVNQDTPKNLLMEIGNIYAKRKLSDSIKPRGDVPAIFPSMQPGAYFEEFHIKERTIKHKDPSMNRFRAEEPIMLGTSEFSTLMDELNRRGKREDTTLNAVIMPDKTIWVLPVRFQDGAISQHSMVTKGNPCVWAGEVTINRDKVVKIRNQSGHFRTVVFDEKGQKSLNNFVLQRFKEQRFKIPNNIELVKKLHIIKSGQKNPLITCFMGG